MKALFGLVNRPFARRSHGTLFGPEYRVRIA